MQHGIAKASALILGLPYHHDGEDLVITSGWSAMLEAFGFSFEGEQPLQIVDASVMFEQQITSEKAAEILAKEHSRKEELEKKRSIQRIAAETNARQQGKPLRRPMKLGV